MAAPSIGPLKEADLKIEEGSVTGKGLREVFKRLFSTFNPYFEGLTKALSKGLTLTENVYCDVLELKLSHGVPQNVTLKTLKKAGSVEVLSAEGSLVVAATVEPVQITTDRPTAKVTAWFNNPSATGVSCTIVLRPEGKASSTTPVYQAPIPASTVTAAGDLIYATAASTVTRLPKGTDGQVLTLASGLPSWATGGGGGGSTTYQSAAKALYVDGADLPAGASAISGMNLTIGTTGTYLILYSASFQWDGGVTLDYSFALYKNATLIEGTRTDTCAVQAGTGGDSIGSFAGHYVGSFTSTDTVYCGYWYTGDGGPTMKDRRIVAIKLA